MKTNWTTIMKTLFTLSAAILLTSFTAFADDAPPKWEVGVDYSFVHFDPARNYFKTKNINGGGLDFVYNVTGLIGIKADFQFYASNSFNYTFPAGTILPDGSPTAAPITGNGQGNVTTYTFGPVIKKHTGVFQPFGQVLLGAGHSNTFYNALKDSGYVSANPNNNGFAMVVGGGIDLRLTKTVSFRPVECDYVLTRFGSVYNGLTPAGTTVPTLNQNSFRYLAGVNFTFGAK
jgi:hypothetical protein